MSEKKYLDYEGLSQVADQIKSRLKVVSVIPETPTDGMIVLFTGTTTTDYKKSHIYEYQTDAWVDVTDTVDEEAREIAAGAVGLAQEAMDMAGDINGIPNADVQALFE